MVEILRSASFDRWLRRLKDTRARARINMRIRRLGLGNPGDVEPIGGGLSEMRIDYGPGYRVYYLQQGRTLAVILGGGTKKTQPKDIAKAQAIAAEWRSKDG